jgi:catechol 1,2-dioxygenase
VRYSNGPSQSVGAVVAAALGRSLYRPAHIHYEIRHPDLLTPYRGEIYFSGDPVIPVDFVGPKIAASSLQAGRVLHEDPEDIAAHGFDSAFNTAVFDFVLRTRTSPDTAVHPQGTERPATTRSPGAWPA